MSIFRVSDAGVTKSVSSWQIIIPLNDNEGNEFQTEVIGAVLDDISLNFPGLTAINCSGIWHAEGKTYHDDNLQVTVDASSESPQQAESYFSRLKPKLQAALGQEKIYVTCQSSKTELLSFDEFFQEAGIESVEFPSEKEKIETVRSIVNSFDFVKARMGFRTITLRRLPDQNKIVWEREVAGIRLRSEFMDNLPAETELVAVDQIDHMATWLYEKAFAVFGSYEMQFYFLDHHKYRPLVRSSLHDDPRFPGKPYKSPTGDTITVAEFVERFTNGVASNIAALRDHGYLPEEIIINVGSDGSVQHGTGQLGGMLFITPGHIPEKDVQEDIIRCITLFLEGLTAGTLDAVAFQQAKACNHYMFNRASMRRNLP